MSSMDIAEFVKARLDEDEAAAKAATPGPWVPETYIDEDEPVGVEYLVAAPAEAHLVAGAGLGAPQAARDTEHIARHDPARVLRDVAAKRATLAAYAPVAYMDGLDEPEYAYGRANGLGEAVRQLAAVWSDHPDYDQAWRP